MDASGREEEDIPGMHVMTGQHFGNRTVGHTLLIFLGSDFLGHAGEEMGPRLGSDDIPHLGLSLGTVMPHGGQFVIGVDLDGQV